MSLTLDKSSLWVKAVQAEYEYLNSIKNEACDAIGHFLDKLEQIKTSSNEKSEPFIPESQSSRYRKLSLKYHPDHGGDPESFLLLKEIASAASDDGMRALEYGDIELAKMCLEITYFRRSDCYFYYQNPGYATKIFQEMINLKNQ